MRQLEKKMTKYKENMMNMGKYQVKINVKENTMNMEKYLGKINEYKMKDNNDETI